MGKPTEQTYGINGEELTLDELRLEAFRIHGGKPPELRPGHHTPNASNHYGENAIEALRGDDGLLHE